MSGKKQKPRHKARAKRREPSGFDYGCLPTALALGSWEFVNHLARAGVVGVAYAYGRSAELSAEVPSVVLLAQRGDALRHAFEDFHAWSDATDGDSVEVTFVFQESGGYVLTLSVEPQRLTFRCLGYDTVHQPMPTFAAWSKQIDSTHPALRSLQEYSRRFPAPILIDGAETLISAPLEMGTSASVQKIAGLKPLLKFYATFIDEQDVQPNTTAALALASVLQKESAHKARSSRSKPPSLPSDTARLRREALRAHFPVTLERLRRNPDVIELIAVLDAEFGVRPWQVEQALCNLTLSTDTLGRPHFLNLKRKAVTETVAQALGTRYEIANGAATHAFTRQEILTQIMADTQALLRCESRGVPQGTIEDSQAALNAAGLLDVAGVLFGPRRGPLADQLPETE
jgi:hypothetical protein